ncbi:MAG TPA: 50S ribosomal protein L17 [Candidatus Acidoferrales bacterium]|jgi:large subunit ribosomal protein L17|nr:50S ribosomal protein L17 [Candidatus Acidoferrales bacterium]
MPHQIAYKRLSRTDGHRKALLRNLATSFFKHEKMETTTTKAKEISKIVERLITQAMPGDLSARRLIAEFITEPAVVKKLVEQIAPALKGRNGGYTRITKTRIRQGDAAELSLIELVK